MIILHLTGNINKKSSGIRNVVNQLCLFQSKKNKVHVIHIQNNNHSFKKDPEWENINLHGIKKYFLGNFGLSLKYFELIKTIKPDIIHLHGVWMFNAIVLRILYKKYKICISTHGMLSKVSLSYNNFLKKFFFHLYLKTLLKKSKLIVTSKNEKADILNLVNADKIKIIPNGLFIEFNSKNNLKKSFKLKKIITVGRLHEKKNLEFLIKSWNKISNKFSDWEFKIIGSGNNKYEKKLYKLNRSKNLIFVKEMFNEDLYHEYISSSLFICLSKDENFGMTIAEAMFFETPVIISDNLPWKMINNLELGWSININDNNFLKKLESILSLNPSEFYSRGKKAKIFIEKEYNWENLEEKIVNFYKE